MAHELEHFTSLPKASRTLKPDSVSVQPDNLGGGIRKRIDFMASHMFSQLKEHEAAQQRTAILFERLLCSLEETVVTFQESFIKREIPTGSVYASIDADRSVGILYLLWHTVSFISRGNIKPLALNRHGREPLFSGRIVATLGDYRETVMELQTHDYSEMLESELASLYIPASPVQPAVMRLRHCNEEFFFNQSEAPQQFLMKILEAVCGGGYYHESTLD